MLRGLGVRHVLHGQCAELAAGVTHVVLPHLARTAKALGAMAAGLWLLGTPYIEACARQHRLLPPVRPARLVSAVASGTRSRCWMQLSC